ncbi:hypothetical protein HS088_TW09G00331 [Tripterygium wilfordii]|uniref:Uncharacterized protein n=1 Tax=Tripterygium wilfordii TaxID=458696 RepID=A0A7J7D7G5_TRIWF|nr:hypothetical protein HS088_TW09G00331 [Tripterygium wilfordii]
MCLCLGALDLVSASTVGPDLIDYALLLSLYVLFQLKIFPSIFAQIFSIGLLVKIERNMVCVIFIAKFDMGFFQFCCHGCFSFSSVSNLGNLVRMVVKCLVFTPCGFPLFSLTFVNNL